MGTWVASSTKDSLPLHQNRCWPGWFMILDGHPREETQAPTHLGMPKGQKRLNDREGPAVFFKLGTDTQHR